MWYGRHVQTDTQMPPSEQDAGLAARLQRSDISPQSALACALRLELFGSEITISHRPGTGKRFSTRGLRNDDITRIVEHVFIAWLIERNYGFSPKVGTDARCLDAGVDPEDFFAASIDPDDFLSDSPEEVSQLIASTAARNEVSAVRAKKVCRGCNQALNCITTATLRQESEGIWGGLTGDERHIISNRFQAMRRDYLIAVKVSEGKKAGVGKMTQSMRVDLERVASQIAANLMAAEAPSAA